MSLASPTLTDRRSPKELSTPRITIVDADPLDYAAWLKEARKGGAECQVVGSGREALRLAATGRFDLWVINCDLPDMAGAELCQMLKSRSPGASICLVSDAHSPEVERAAYAARATMYAVKPAHLECLRQWFAPLVPDGGALTQK